MTRDESDANNTGPRRVVLGMSGGVDSSVAALLLKQDGFDVTGVTLVLRDDPNSPAGCSGPGHAVLAAQTAHCLGIDHKVIDYRDPFKEHVLRYCWNEYNRGRTPNPCVLCNAAIKFKVLRDIADQMNIGHIASGHYARLMFQDDQPVLLRGTDRSKDQSYFLFALPSEVLTRLILPLGDLSKSKIRVIAKDAMLPGADRPESQDACFSEDHSDFAESLRNRFNGEIKKGAFISMDSRELGLHEGIHCYTIGQRRKLGIALGRRAYVTEIDPVARTVRLTTQSTELKRLALRGRLTRMHARLESGKTICQVQIRYRTPAVPATVIHSDDEKVYIRFERPVNAVTPGQAFVMYDNDRVLGGGWIDESIPDIPSNHFGDGSF